LPHLSKNTLDNKLKQETKKLPPPSTTATGCTTSLQELAQNTVSHQPRTRTPCWEWLGRTPSSPTDTAAMPAPSPIQGPLPGGRHREVQQHCPPQQPRLHHLRGPLPCGQHREGQLHCPPQQPHLHHLRGPLPGGQYIEGQLHATLPIPVAMPALSLTRPTH
jgi:hypothetical protein